jgi:hypothetical protein
LIERLCSSTVVVHRDLADVPRGRLQQVGLDPVGELRRHHVGDLGGVDALLAGHAQVAHLQLLLDLLADDEVGQHVAGAVLHGDARAASRHVGAGIERVDDAVGDLVLLALADVLLLGEADHHRGGLAHLVLGVGGVVAVRGDGPATVLVAPHRELARFGRALDELGHLEVDRGGRIGELREEQIALVTEQIVLDLPRTQRRGEQGQHDRPADDGARLDHLAHAAPPLT